MPFFSLNCIFHSAIILEQTRLAKEITFRPNEIKSKTLAYLSRAFGDNERFVKHFAITYEKSKFTILQSGNYRATTRPRKQFQWGSNKPDHRY